ncbi:hypothetical protein MMC28_000082 [Mycoblastus sanguinarius]|nr:hypothetical protein [Mycoblastus sanguinarius]
MAVKYVNNDGHTALSGIRKDRGKTAESLRSSSSVSLYSASRSFRSKNKPKSWTCHLLSLLVSFLWLAPIITLLVLNFKRQIIGASVWCPFGKCSSDAFDDSAIAITVEVDKKDHDILAGLQFVAQALEMWFMIIATALLYDVTMAFARSHWGLPVGYIWTHLEFSDIKNLINPLLWTSAFPRPGASSSERKRFRSVKPFLFALLAVILTILTSLMGAATAVLLIPTLQWVETEQTPQQRFNGIALAQPPRRDAVFPGSCNNSQLLAGNFSCTSRVYGPSLDEWAATGLASTEQ